MIERQNSFKRSADEVSSIKRFCKYYVKGKGRNDRIVTTISLLINIGEFVVTKYTIDAEEVGYVYTGSCIVKDVTDNDVLECLVRLRNALVHFNPRTLYRSFSYVLNNAYIMGSYIVTDYDDMVDGMLRNISYESLCELSDYINAYFKSIEYVDRIQYRKMSTAPVSKSSFDDELPPLED